MIPAPLLHGSNALAGVVNVVRGYVPSERPDGFGGSETYQGESVNRGLVAEVVAGYCRADAALIAAPLRARDETS